MTYAAPPLEVAGSPRYDAVTKTGMIAPYYPTCAVNNSGTAVWYCNKYVGESFYGKGSRAVRWNADGTEAVELGSLSFDSYGKTTGCAYAINNAGTSVGYSGTFAVRWAAGGTAATQLQSLDAWWEESIAYAINDSGVTVGQSHFKPVRWDAGTTVATALEYPASDNTWEAAATAVNAAGTAIGYLRESYIDEWGRSYEIETALRWEPGTANMVRLGSGIPVAINSTGTVVGNQTFDNLQVAVRWEAGSASPTELPRPTSWAASSHVSDINDAGTSVGAIVGRAVRWDAGATNWATLEVLWGHLDDHTPTNPYSVANAINAAGTIVGKCTAPEWSSPTHAVVWLPDGTIIDLNKLGLVSVTGEAGTWTLTEATDISDDGYVTGGGTFYPVGAHDVYQRLWVAQVGLGGSWLNTSGVNNTWGKGPNWSTGTPAIQRDALFNKAAAYNVAFDKDQVTRAASVSAGDVTFVLGAHSLTLTDGLTVGAGARLVSNGTIVGNVINAGSLAPGNSAGTLTIQGNLQSTGILDFEINGCGGGQFDRLLISGQAGLGGMVRIMLAYEPAAGDRFDLMDWQSLVDGGYTFDFSQAGLPSGLTWDTGDFASSGQISVVPEPATLMLLLGGVFVFRRKAPLC